MNAIGVRSPKCQGDNVPGCIAVGNEEAALLFTSACVANELTLSRLSMLIRHAVILSDEKNHASILKAFGAAGTSS